MMTSLNDVGNDDDEDRDINDNDDDASDNNEDLDDNTSNIIGSLILT